MKVVNLGDDFKKRSRDKRQIKKTNRLLLSGLLLWTAEGYPHGHLWVTEYRLHLAVTPPER